MSEPQSLNPPSQPKSDQTAEPGQPAAASGTGITMQLPVNPLAEAPAPAPGSEQLTSYESAARLDDGIERVFAQLAAGNTKDEAFASAGEAARQLCLMLKSDAASLRGQLHESNKERVDLRQKYHQADKGSAVLEERLQSMGDQLLLLYGFEWLFAFLYAIGGGLISVSSLLDMALSAKVVLVIVGLAIIVVPAIFKARHRPQPSKSEAPKGLPASG
jgi:hypothetical protein